MVADLGLGLFVEGVSLAKSVGELLGLTESIGEKIDLLRESQLKTGMQELEQAVDSITERKSLLRSARSHFNTAATMESGYELCLSYIGLATCHAHLEDLTNARHALDKTLQIKSETSTKDWAVAMFNEGFNPKALTNKKWIKKRFREAFDFRNALDLRANFSRGIRQFTKKEAMGPVTEKLLEDQKKLLFLQKVARTELSKITLSDKMS